MTFGNISLGLLCLGGSLAMPGTVPAADYYVSSGGADASAGTAEAAAWKSIARVNAASFRPGDRVLFQAGRDFPGNLRLGANSAGRSNAPVVITSFGAGRARLRSGGETGITVENAGWVTISNLVVVGDGATNNTGYGVRFENGLEGFQRLEGVRVEAVEACGFGMFGLFISGRQAGFEHVRIVGCDLHDNLRAGIEISGRLDWNSPLYAHADVEVRRCRAHDNSGDPLYVKNHSGSGMVLYQVDGGRVADCRAWGNGRLCRQANGGVGIWACASRGVVIERCESFENRTGGGDGGGFDLDGGSTDCVLQYNYTHDNDGPGLLVYTYRYASHSDRGNVVRFNVSDHDSRKTRTYAGLWVRNDGNGMTGLKVYNNTVRMGPWSDQAAYVDGNGVEAEFHHNLLVGGAQTAALRVEHPVATLRFQHNLYWGEGSPLRIRWGESEFGTLAAWEQATGQEVVGGKALGLCADPQFGGVQAAARTPSEDWRARLTAFQPLRGSVALNTGAESAPEATASGADIMGNVLSPTKWPIGAVGTGSL